MHLRSLALLLPLLTPLAAQQLAPTPPMGWNSWDSYGTTLTETEFRANVGTFARYLAGAGYRYAVIDIQWYTPNPPARGSYTPDPHNVTLDAFGRFIPAPNRFPSSADGAGFRPLADMVHANGLKFGIHIMRGIPRYAVEQNLPIEGTYLHAADIADKQHVADWKGMTDTYGVDMSRPGAQAWYDSIVRLYASWGVDYIKADDMAAPFHADEIAALHTAILHSGHPIVLSLSPGPSPLAEHAVLAANANLWRISGDFWDRWPDIQQHFDLMKSWQPFVAPNHWPDADMLPLGHIALRGENGSDRQSRLTHDEQRTLMTLWAIFRSPLILGGDLPSMLNEPDHWTLNLVTNRDVITLDQRSRDNQCILLTPDLAIWTARTSTPDHFPYLAVFNRSDATQTITRPWSELGLEFPTYIQEDLWTHLILDRQSSLTVTLAPHASALYLLKPEIVATQ